MDTLHYEISKERTVTKFKIEYCDVKNSDSLQLILY